MRPLIIIHGWSDDSDSFSKPARLVERSTNRDVHDLWLGDYISMDDDVRMSDITAAMQRAWMDNNIALSGIANSCDAIIHSTGGLVIREWMTDNWFVEGKKPPIANLAIDFATNPLKPTMAAFTS